MHQSNTDVHCLMVTAGLRCLYFLVQNVLTCCTNSLFREWKMTQHSWGHRAYSMVNALLNNVYNLFLLSITVSSLRTCDTNSAQRLFPSVDKCMLYDSKNLSHQIYDQNLSH